MTDSLVRPNFNDTSYLDRGDEHSATVVGAGPAGALISILLARRGYRITALERLPDLRRTSGSAGRSINLALADRGIHALKCAGVFDDIEPFLVPMRGRMLHHQDGTESFVPYGTKPHEMTYSIERAKLTAALLSCAESKHRVDVRFRQTCISVDASRRELCMQDIPTGKLYSLALRQTIGADGAGSVLRRFLVERADATCSEEILAHGYKELTIAPGADNVHRFVADALHVWPRGEFMLIALPNIDGSFTATLFLQHDGPCSFATLTTAAAVRSFFERYFPDVYRVLPDLTQQFLARPIGSMGTVRCEPWSLAGELLLIGDAAHAIVPFHGQGMNCAFEDCIELDGLLATLEWSAACAEFQRRRIANCNAIAEMALENYVVMRDRVRDPQFLLQNELSFELERRHPERFIPRYSMVMFHHEIPYAQAFERGRVQAEILDELTREQGSLEQIDYARAAQLVESRLSKLP